MFDSIPAEQRFKGTPVCLSVLLEADVMLALECDTHQRTSPSYCCLPCCDSRSGWDASPIPACGI